MFKKLRLFVKSWESHFRRRQKINLLSEEKIAENLRAWNHKQEEWYMGGCLAAMKWQAKNIIPLKWPESWASKWKKMNPDALKGR